MAFDGGVSDDYLPISCQRRLLLWPVFIGVRVHLCSGRTWQLVLHGPAACPEAFRRGALSAAGAPTRFLHDLAWKTQHGLECACR